MALVSDENTDTTTPLSLQTIIPDISANQNILSPSVSIGSSVSNCSSPIRKHRFDDRAQTRISLALRTHKSDGSRDKSPFAAKKSNISDSSVRSESILELAETPNISEIINSPNFRTTYGTVECIEPSNIYIATGTKKGFVVGFNYNQGLEFVLCPHSDTEGSKNQFETGSVASIAFSSDSMYLVAGYTNGGIITWNLASTSTTSAGYIRPLYIIEPTSLENRFTRNIQGHLHGISVNSVGFLGSLHFQLVSSDVSGLVFYHHGFKRFMKKHFQSQKLLGRNDANSSDNNGRYIIHACEMLPLGSAHQITDYLGLVAVMTGNVLAIISVLSLNNPHMVNLKIHYKTGRPKQNSKLPSTSGYLSWYPCMKNEGNKVDNARLAYAWGNIVTILEIDNISFPENLFQVIGDLKDKDKAIPTVPIKRTCRWITSNKGSSIVSLKWISNNILLTYTENSGDNGLFITALHYTMKDGERILIPIGHDSLQDLQILSSKILISSIKDTSNRIHENYIKNFNNSIKVFKNKLMILAEDDNNLKLIIGCLINWANRLLNLLSLHEYSKALITANEFYVSNNIGYLLLSGLPESRDSRCYMLRPYLLNIMKESVNSIFKMNDKDHEFHLTLYLDIISYLYKEPDSDSNDLYSILEMVFEVLNNQSLFFNTVEFYILSGKIWTLSPLILKSLVEYYIRIDKGDLLTEIICIMDVRTLDIDLTIQLCKEYKLRDSLIYIYNYLLGDYSNPFADFIKDIKASEEEDCMHVYPYMSYILTGRQYPTEKFIDAAHEKRAKESIYLLLFSSTTIRYPDEKSDLLIANDEETVFPYLFALLQFNSFEMLSTINEFFEDSILNDDNTVHINRQYIIEALLDIFEVNESKFSDFDRCNLAIFIARNFPKYSQFIRLSESILNKVVDDLCAVGDLEMKYDCELALQCLLQLYQPEGEILLLEKLKSAKFYNVLISIYRSKGKYSNVLKIWLERATIDSTENDSLSGIIEDAFKDTKSPSDRAELIAFLRNNFQQILVHNIRDFVTLIHRYYPSLASEILKVNDDDIFYKYMNCLLQMTDLKNIKLGNIQKFIGRYIRVLCDKDPDKVYSFTENAVTILARDGDEFEQTKSFLRQKGSVEALTTLLLVEKEYEISLDELIQSMKQVIYVAASNDNAGKLFDQFDRYLRRAMYICEIEDTYSQKDGELYLNEKMWLRLIGSCVEMSNNVVSQELMNDKKEEVSVFLDKCIYSCFKRLSEAKLDPNRDENQKREKSFLTVFNRFLENSSTDSNTATLSNIRDILREVFISYTYENEMLNISLKILNESIRENLDLVRLDNLKAWPIKIKSCTSCGKVMWGAEVSKEHFMAWEDRQREALILAQGLGNPETDALFNKQKYHLYELIFFKCNHGYHMSCLENLGRKEVKSCVLCLQ